MPARAIMFQGTASHVGKSVVTAAACRLFARVGYRVAPFKGQNMSNNSFVTEEGGEIGRSQAFQARAAGVEPRVDMNPILLKPSGGERAQVVRLGHPVHSMGVGEYHDYQKLAWNAITEAYGRLSREYDMIVIEGAGSPAEVNLRGKDIANMKVAAHAQAPVVLIGDIERGGVFASLVGTMSLLEPDVRPLVKALLINRFRGALSFLVPGLAYLESETGLPVLGVLPFDPEIAVEEEDSVALEALAAGSGSRPLDIAVIHLPHISNATDFQPLQSEPDVALRFVRTSEAFGEPQMVILPGSKSTVADFRWMQERGLDRRLVEHHRAGGWIIGICGGYQMLGQEIRDPEGVESVSARSQGLGLLPLTTTFSPRKRLVQVEAECALPGLEGIPVRGYEIHQGHTISNSVPPAFRLRREFDQAVKEVDGAAAGLECFGTYLHGLFDSYRFRRRFLNRLREELGLEPLPLAPNEAAQPDFDRLADWLSDNVDLRLLGRLVGLKVPV